MEEEDKSFWEPRRHKLRINRRDSEGTVIRHSCEERERGWTCTLVFLWMVCLWGIRRKYITLEGHTVPNESVRCCWMSNTQGRRHTGEVPRRVSGETQRRWWVLKVMPSCVSSVTDCCNLPSPPSPLLGSDSLLSLLVHQIDFYK